MARDEGVLIAVNSDAHSTFDFANLRFGIGQARRGWLEPEDVLNTRTLAKLRPLLKRTMNRAGDSRGDPAGMPRPCGSGQREFRRSLQESRVADHNVEAAAVSLGLSGKQRKHRQWRIGRFPFPLISTRKG